MQDIAAELDADRRPAVRIADGLAQHPLNEEDEAVLENKVYLDQKRRERKMVYKNIITISVGFLGLFTAFVGLVRLQSSIHRDKGIGVITQSILYGALVISSLFVPQVMIRFLGHKRTLCVSMIGYMTWIAANGYAVWGTMVTTSLIVGVCAAPLWTAKCAYFTRIAVIYSKSSKEQEDAVITRFFGIFFMFYQLCQIFSSIITSTVLYNKPQNVTKIPDIFQECGHNDNPWKNYTNINLKKPNSVTLWILVGIYAGLAVLAFLMIVIFMDPLPNENGKEGTESLSGGRPIIFDILATVKQMRQRQQLLLLPLTFYGGFEQAFYLAEWTKSFVSCTLGIWQVGLLNLPFGIVNVLASFIAGRLVKHTGRLPIFTTGFVIDVCIQVTLMTWIPNQLTTFVLYILSALWGISDAVWQTQLNGIYGALFCKESEAAFSNYRVWQSLGFIVGFAYSNFLATSIKIYNVTGVLCFGMLCYYYIEFSIWKTARKPNISAEEREVERLQKLNLNHETTSMDNRKQPGKDIELLQCTTTS